LQASQQQQLTLRDSQAITAVGVVALEAARWVRVAERCAANAKKYYSRSDRRIVYHSWACVRSYCASARGHAGNNVCALFCAHIRLANYWTIEMEGMIMTTADHIEELHQQGWTRVDTAPGEWVALVPNDNNSAFGGTLWRLEDDGNYYAEGVTEGHPISAALGFEAAARAVAVFIKEELGDA
jgi:hypothetical protein